VNVDTNTDGDAPPLFRRASQNLTAAAMLLRSCPKAATSEERRVRQQLMVLLEAATAQQAESSASRQRGRAGARSAHGPNPPPSQHQDRAEGGRAVASAVKSRLGPGRDAWNTIEARQQAGSVDKQCDIRSHHHNDRGSGRRYDNDDDRDRSWSLN
jgi:hypothetical protein